MATGEMCCKADWLDFRRRSGNAKCYVRMIDSLMSGWGQARDKRNVLYVPVVDLQDAYKLRSWIWWKRPEMKRVDYGYFSDKPPASIYDRSALVQGCVYGCWLKEAGCKPIEGGIEE